MQWALGAALLVPHVALNLVGVYLLKVSQPGANPRFVLGFGAYAASFLIWVRILKLLPLSVVFPIAAGVLMVGTQLVGFLRFGEPLTVWKGLGVALILGGIVILRGGAVAS